MSAVSKPVMRRALLLSLLLLPACVPKPPPAGVVLSAAPVADVTADQPVVLALTLKNNTRGTVRLSQLAEANLRVASFKKDGVDLAPSSEATFFDQALARAVERSLRPAAPGASVNLSWMSVAGGGQTQALQTADALAEPSTVVSYGVATPGRYEVTLAYRYGGAKPSDPTVHTAETNTVKVAFVVR
jgi:hypothetical protein